MGFCISETYKNLENILSIGEQEVTFEIYSSNIDKILEPIESVYNIYKNFQNIVKIILLLFLLLLYN